MLYHFLDDHGMCALSLDSQPEQISSKQEEEEEGEKFI